MSCTLVLQTKLVSPNKKTHWSKTYQLNKKIDSELVYQWLRARPVLKLPVQVTITRIAPRPFDLQDNLPIACKGLVDSIAALLRPGYTRGRADGSPDITWVYKQAKGAVREYKVIVTIEEQQRWPDSPIH